MILRWVMAAVLAVTAAPRRAHACAGCSNPHIPEGRQGAILWEAGELVVGARTTATTIHVVHESRCPDLGPVCDQGDEPPRLHDQRFYITELRALAAYGLTPSVGVELELPLRLTRTSIIYRRMDGSAFEPVDANLHHRNETLVGLGDPLLAARLRLALEEVWFVLRLGVTVPLGHTEPNPFALGERGLVHQHIQFGTGTVDPLAGVSAATRFGELTATLYAHARLALYNNRHGHRPGAKLGGGGSLRIPFTTWAATALVEAAYEAPERWDGVIRQDGNLGRTDVLLGAEVSRAFGDSELGLAVRVPIYSRVVTGPDAPGKLSYPLILSVGITTDL